MCSSDLSRVDTAEMLFISPTFFSTIAERCALTLEVRTGRDEIKPASDLWRNYGTEILRCNDRLPGDSCS